MTDTRLASAERGEAETRDLEHLWHPYTATDVYAANQIVVVAAEGAHVVDIHGRRYVDAIAGLWNVQVGHGRREIVDVVTEQLEQLAYSPLNGRSHLKAVELAARLAELAPGDLTRVFFATGGAEAVETAIKLARQFWRQRGQPDRVKVIGLERGWHGCTLGALSASGIEEERAPFGPLLDGFPKIPPPYCYRCPWRDDPDDCPVENGAALEEAIVREGPETVAAFLGEPVLGLAGMIPPRPRFWEEAQRVCRRYDVLLVVDEVAVGFGRTGSVFASEQFGIEPDLLACAKGITSAYLPLAAVLATERIHAAFLGEERAFMHGYTFGGHPAACAAALANLEIIEREGLCERAVSLGAELLDELRIRLRDCTIVGDVRGIGLALAVELVRDRASREPLRVVPHLCRELARRGILVRPVGDGNVLPLVPPLSIERDVALEVVDRYCGVVRELERGELELE